MGKSELRRKVELGSRRRGEIMRPVRRRLDAAGDGQQLALRLLLLL